MGGSHQHKKKQFRDVPSIGDEELDILKNQGVLNVRVPHNGQLQFEDFHVWVRKIPGQKPYLGDYKGITVFGKSRKRGRYTEVHKETVKKEIILFNKSLYARYSFINSTQYVRPIIDLNKVERLKPLMARMLRQLYMPNNAVHEAFSATSKDGIVVSQQQLRDLTRRGCPDTLIRSRVIKHPTNDLTARDVSRLEGFGSSSQKYSENDSSYESEESNMEP